MDAISFVLGEKSNNMRVSRLSQLEFEINIIFEIFAPILIKKIRLKRFSGEELILADPRSPSWTASLKHGPSFSCYKNGGWRR